MGHEINKWLKGIIQQDQYNKPTLSAFTRTFWQLKKPTGKTGWNLSNSAMIFICTKKKTKNNRVEFEMV